MTHELDLTLKLEQKCLTSSELQAAVELICLTSATLGGQSSSSMCNEAGTKTELHAETIDRSDESAMPF